MALPSKVPVQVKALKCPQCGAPLTLRNPHQARSIVCSSCNSVRDPRDPNLGLLWSYAEKLKFPCAIPLGARGNFEGQPWECIGMLVRKTVVEGTSYHWSEYLLWNPYRGYRWLVEAQGNWIFVKPLLETPKERPVPGRLNMELDDVEFKCFQSCEATVVYVLGELYWQVERGESSRMVDYVAPPRMLSLEKGGNEMNWSACEHVAPDAVYDAFGGKVKLPEPRGIGPATPNPFSGESTGVTTVMLNLIAAAFFIQVLFLFVSQDKQVLNWTEGFTTEDTEKSRVSPTFELTGRRCGVMVKSQCDVFNHWIFLGCALINEDTQVAYDFGREISYYAGADEDGSWSEGSQSDEAWLPSVPSGKYYLRVEPQSDMPRAQYTIVISRDPARIWPFLVAIFLILIPPIFHAIRHHMFEVKRWAESDYPMVSQSSDDED